LFCPIKLFYTFLLFSNSFPYFTLIKYCSYRLLLIRNFRSVHFNAHSPHIVHFNRSLCFGNLKQHKLHILEDLFFQAHIFTFLRTHMIKLIYQCYRRDYSFYLTVTYVLYRIFQHANISFASNVLKVSLIFFHIGRNSFFSLIQKFFYSTKPIWSTHTQRFCSSSS
jgi:hypothetical protein